MQFELKGNIFQYEVEEETGVDEDDDYTPPQHDYLPPGLQEHEDSLSQVLLLSSPWLQKHDGSLSQVL